MSGRDLWAGPTFRDVDGGTEGWDLADGDIHDGSPNAHSIDGYVLRIIGSGAGGIPQLWTGVHPVEPGDILRVDGWIRPVAKAQAHDDSVHARFFTADGVTPTGDPVAISAPGAPVGSWTRILTRTFQAAAEARYVQFGVQMGMADPPATEETWWDDLRIEVLGRGDEVVRLGAIVVSLTGPNGSSGSPAVTSQTWSIRGGLDQGALAGAIAWGQSVGDTLIILPLPQLVLSATDGQVTDRIAVELDETGEPSVTSGRVTWWSRLNRSALTRFARVHVLSVGAVGGIVGVDDDTGDSP